MTPRPPGAALASILPVETGAATVLNVAGGERRGAICSRVDRRSFAAIRRKRRWTGFAVGRERFSPSRNGNGVPCPGNMGFSHLVAAAPALIAAVAIGFLVEIASS